MPQQCGGSQTSALELADALQQTGMDVAIAARLDRRSAFGLRAVARMSVKRRRFDVTRFRSHSVYRATSIADQIEAVVGHWRPDVTLIQGMSAMGLARSLIALRVPTVIYWRDVEIHKLLGTPVGLRARFLANSQFTASFYESAFGVQSVVVPPLVQRERYRAHHHDRETVLFVGSSPEKGLDIAIGVAALCPDIPFEFLESWILTRSARRLLLARLSHLQNVKYLRNQSDMRPAYGRARLLLAPSQWQEAWGRVVSEAHINAIPVLGSRIGGLPESVGPGGLLISPTAPLSEWSRCIQELWKNDALYRQLAQAAEDYSYRQELDPEWALGRIVDELTSATNP